MIWKLIAWIVSRERIADWLVARAMRTPYAPIVKDGEIYMGRFWLFNPYSVGLDGKEVAKYKWFPWSIRIHRIHMADRDEHMHDHPWNARTIILRGFYTEAQPFQYDVGTVGHRLGVSEIRNVRFVGDTRAIRFGEYHKIVSIAPEGATTLFISGPYQGTWGFLVDGVKIYWRTYLGLNK